MSFGASPSDVIIVVRFCRALYRKCRDAGGEYEEISREVRGLHTVLKHLKYEVEAPESTLNRDRSLWGRQLAPVIGNCDLTLKQLDGLLQKYRRLSDGGSSPSSPRISWDRIRLGSDEMDTLGTIRVKLISHKTSLTSFLDTIQLHQSGKEATTLDNHTGQLDVILDKVDGIAARMGQRSGSILTTYDDDDKEVWKQFRRELIAEGFASDVLTQHKDVLRAYIREIDQKGLLDEMPPQPLGAAQQDANPQQWLDDIHSAPPPEGPPPTFESLHTLTNDGGAKEMVVREENMKFPQSMKFERRKPETRHSDLQRELDNLNLSRDTIARTPRTSPAVPKLITSSSEKDEKEIQYYNTDGSSSSDAESENSSRHSKRKTALVKSKAPQMGVVIRTSDLFKTTQGPKLLLPASPKSFRSSQGSIHEDEATRSMATRPQNTAGDSGSSPSRAGAIPIPSTNPRHSGESFSTSPLNPIRLAPDEYGNEIPPDAKWTRINRRLVSPEVLDQDHRRYEARPEWVAVLGVLSRAEIEDYAARSAILRSARRRPFPSEIPPEKPPRPTIPIPLPRTNSNSHPNSAPRERQRSRHNTHTPSTSDSDSSDSSHLRAHSNRHQPHLSSSRDRNRERNYADSDLGVPVSGYPNPFGQPTPSPHSQSSPFYPPPAASSHSHHEREEGRRPSNRRHYSHSNPSSSSHSKPSHSSRDREREREKEREAIKHQKVSRWKENLTAASIGGAAVSLLNVLTEAAEGL